MNRRRFLRAAAATPAAAFIPDGGSGGGTGTGTGGTTPPRRALPTVDRLRDLYNQGAISRNEVADALAEAAIERARRQIEASRIYQHGIISLDDTGWMIGFYRPTSPFA